MQKIYKTNLAKKNIEKLSKIEPDCWISLVNPTEEEIANTVSATGIDEDLISKMLDDDELPRVEVSGKSTLVVIDIPAHVQKDDKYVTYPLGIIVTNDNYIVTVSLNNPTILQDFANNRIRDFRTAKKTRFLIQIINAAAAQYVKVLDDIYRQMQVAEESLKKYTKNENLIDMLGIEKTLVYFIASLKENDVVLERLSKGIVLPLFDDDADMLEDAIIENRQAIDMATIYRDILSSISETYGTIINNNLNYAMKFLAGATIVLSIPTIISSFIGMNVPFGIIGSDPHSAVVILLASILASLLVAVWLRRKGLL